MFLSRTPRSGSDRFLPFKLAALLIGCLLGLVGMAISRPLVVDLAIGVVLVGFLLRFLPRRSP